MQLICTQLYRFKYIKHFVDFAVSADHRVKLRESDEKDKYLDLSRKMKKLSNMKVTVIPVVLGLLGTVTKRISTEIGGLRNKKSGGGHQNYNFIKIGQNT